MRAVAVTRLLAGEQQQVEAGGPEAVLDADEHLMEERVLKVRVVRACLEEDAHHVRTARDECARRGLRRVVELLGEAHDALAGVVPNVGIAVEGAGHGANRDSTQAGQLADCDGVLWHVPKTFSVTCGGSKARTLD